jgi:putative ABC transport system substrate-binding protein
MNRRTFLCGLALGTLAAPLVGEGQGTRRIPRVGFVVATSPEVGRQSVAAFRQGLAELGYIDGQNIVIEMRWAEGKPERFSDLIADLLRSNVDVLVVASSIGARAAKNADTTTPVVFVSVTDPIGAGVVTSLARPGGNLTGTSLVISEEFAGKWVELVKDALPRVSSMAALSHTDHPMARKYVKVMEVAARTLGLKLQIFEVRDVGGLRWRPVDDCEGAARRAHRASQCAFGPPSEENRRFRSSARDPDDRARSVTCRGWHARVVRAKYR